MNNLYWLNAQKCVGGKYRLVMWGHGDTSVSKWVLNSDDTLIVFVPKVFHWTYVGTFYNCTFLTNKPSDYDRIKLLN